MDFFIANALVSDLQQWLYNFLLIAYFIYLFRKYRGYNVIQYFLFLFTIGISADIGRLVSLGNSVRHLFMVVVFIWGATLLNKYGFKSKREIIGPFMLFVLYFFANSIALHNDNIPLVVAQLFKYGIPVISFFLIDSYITRERKKGYILIHNAIRDIVLAQIVFAVFKLFILRAATEGWVGSISGLGGGGAGTSFPLLALLWLGVVSKMKISKKLILYSIGLLFVGFMTGKRAIWILFPIEFAILYLIYNVKTRGELVKFILPAILAMLIFGYLGLRLSPTLNPEGKVGGSFDLQYAYEYALVYSGGEEAAQGEVNMEEGSGRLGSALLFWNALTNVMEYDKTVLLGHGNEAVKYYDKDDYFDKDANFGISYRGGVTGIAFMYFVIGLIGVILFLNYFAQIIFQRRNSKLIWMIFFVTMFDYIFYNGQIVENVAMQSLLFIIVIVQNIDNRKKLKG